MKSSAYHNIFHLVAACGILLFSSVPAVSRDLPDFIPLVEKNSVAVVHISTTQSRRSPGSNPHILPDIPEDSPFYDFFRKYFGENPEGEQPFQERSSLGSGFIIAKEGYVITNNHVVENADEIVVRLNDRRELDAEIIGVDKRSDIAVLKIDAEDLPVLKLGDSSRLRVGEWVLAIGSPFNLDYSVTKGIVSAIGRPLPNESYVPFIQTDVPINPGNSGGPLINMDGEVVGVNSQIYSRTGGFMGLSFAVPSNLVKNVYQQIRDQGHVSRGWLGVLIQEVNRDLAESFGMKKPQGALVARVLPDSPADDAGLEVGDVIVRFDGNEVNSSQHLPAMVGNTPIGTVAPLEIIRRGKKQTLRVTIAVLPEEDEIASTGEGESKSSQGSSADNKLKLAVRDLSDNEREELEIGSHGILVEHVMSGPASKAGIRPGDIILLLNNIKVLGVAHFVELINDLPTEKSIPVLIQRRGNPIFMALKLQESDAG
jgi:serine protease Do